MKVLVYFESQDKLKNSGIGHALSHQERALALAQVPFTTDKRDSFDLAHINTVFFKSRRLLRKCHKLGIPVIVHGHSTYEDFRDSFAFWRLMEPFFDSFLKFMYSHADMVITPTPYSKALIEGYHLSEAPVIAISNGIDVDSYKEDPAAIKAFRDRYGIKEGEKFVMGVGFPFERKGLASFFETARAFPNVKFIWFGHLANILTSHKMKKAIRKRPKNAIMAGYAEGKIIHGAYSSASAMLFPSFEETEGIVVLEALASRTPLVARDIGVYKPWLKDGFNAHLAKDDAGFIREIGSLLKDGEKKEILDAGHMTASERTLDKVGAQLKDAYETLLKGKAK